MAEKFLRIGESEQMVIYDDSVQPYAIYTSGKIRADQGVSVAEPDSIEHGALDGLEDDDHPQYHNDARGDARYPTLADGNGKIKFTPEGGLAVLLTNKTGAASVKGSIVHESNTDDDAFALNPADIPDAIGAVYDDGIADGADCWVVIAGRCQVLLEDSTSATRGYWVTVSATTAGRADITNASPPGGGIPEHDDHFKEVGHCIQSVGAGTDVLAYVIVHFN